MEEKKTEERKEEGKKDIPVIDKIEEKKEEKKDIPVVKKTKAKPLITIVDETDFDLFVKLSGIPSDLKINKIYLEWYEELKKLFYKKKNSEYKSFLLADEFIVKKYKK